MTTLETGKLGLSSQEVDQERSKIIKAVLTRAGITPGKTVGPCDMTGHHTERTPQEIHRGAVLDAITMANCLLCYGQWADWDRHAAGYQTQQIWSTRGYGPTQTYGYSQEQNDAYHLTKQECDQIWHAQRERMKSAKVLTGVHTDPDGASYNAIIW